MLKGLAIALLTSFLYFQDLSLVLTDALRSEETFHILAIPPLFVYLLYRKRKVLAAAVSQEKLRSSAISKHFSTIFGIVLSALALLLYWNTSYTFTPLEYHMLTMPIFIAGLVLILFNVQTLRQLIFPIAFLVFLTPPPAEILYSVGSTLSTVTAQASNGLANLFGIASQLSGNYGNPLITLTRPDNSTMNFTVSVACSGIYSLIGFTIFALFIAYITRGKLRNKLAILLMGLPLIVALNVLRITSIVTIGYYYGDELALQIFHLIGGTVLMFIGTLMLLAVTEKVFKKPKPLLPCPTCKSNLTNSKDEFCQDCGKLLKHSIPKIRRSDLAKIATIAIVVLMLLSIQAPVFALTEGPAEVLVQTPSGIQGNTQILPQIEGYKLQYMYRDQNFEELSGSDAALVYYYTPANSENMGVWVAVEVAPTISSLHRWDYCLSEYPLTAGYLPSIKQLELRDVQIQDNPAMLARFFGFQYRATNQTQLVLYWYEAASFSVNGTTEKKLVEISLIVYPQTPQDIEAVESQLLPFALAINTYWQPVKTWNLVNLVLTQNGLVLSTALATLMAIILIYRKLSDKREKLRLSRVAGKLPEQDKQVLEAVRMASKSGKSTTAEVANQLRALTKDLAVDWLPLKLKEAENAGLVEQAIVNRNDEPVVQWKSRVPEVSKLHDQESESTFYKFLSNLHLPE